MTDIETHSLDRNARRFERQVQFDSIGQAGQDAIARSRVAIVGLGALGSTIADRLVRAGVGHLKLIDRDWVEWNNLPRQALYTEADATNQVPKAMAAARHLSAIDNRINIEPLMEDLIAANVQSLLANVDLILDGTDNFETRYLINDFSLANRVPWIHGGCVGASGQVMVVLPGETACYRCLLPEAFASGTQATCDTVGVIGPAVSIIAAWQSLEAMKLLAGRREDVTRDLIQFELWRGEVRRLGLSKIGPSDRCPACRGEYDFLAGNFDSQTTVLCGRNAVQVQPLSSNIDLQNLERRLRAHGAVELKPFLLKFSKDSYVLTVFANGRAIVSGTEDPSQARAIYSRWIGM